MPRQVDLSELDRLDELLNGRYLASEPGKPVKREGVTVIEAAPLIPGKGGIQSFNNRDSSLGESVRENYNNLMDENFSAQDAAAEKSRGADENLSSSRGAVVRKAAELSGDAEEAKKRLGGSRGIMLKLILNQAREAANPPEVPQRDFSGNDLQKSLRDQMAELKKQPDDISEMDKIVSGLGPALVGLLAGGDAGMNALKLSNDEMNRVRERITGERKSKIENIGKQIEGTGKLLSAEAEVQKANSQRIKDQEEMRQSRSKALADSIKALTDKDLAAFQTLIKEDPELVKTLFNADSSRADKSDQNAVNLSKETNQTVREGVKQYQVAEDKNLDRQNDLKKAEITAKAAAQRAATARAEKPPTEGQTNYANAYASMTKAEQAYDRLLKDTGGAAPSLSAKFYDYQKSLFETPHNVLMGEFLKQIPSGPERRQIQAEMDWLAPKLRKESGAAISVGEYLSYGNTFFPRKGDDQSLVAEKAASRKQARENFRVGAGRAPIPEVIQPDFKSQDLSRDQKIKRLKQLEGK